MQLVILLTSKYWSVTNTDTTRMGFEPMRAEHNGLAVHRLNHSATSSTVCSFLFQSKVLIQVPP